METAPEIETVYSAVDTLYNSFTDTEKASQWLEEFQSSVYAWKIADQMLRDKRSLNSCYFAAQTMRTKIQNSFLELPPEAHISLRDSLLEHLDQVNHQTNSAIVTQLSLALATFALQMLRWEKPVLDLMARYSTRSPSMLLEILVVLPEEVHSRAFRLGDNRRKQVVDQLTQCAPNVYSFLQHCLSKYGDVLVVHERVLKCYASWVMVGALDMNDTPDFLQHVFHVLNTTESSQLHETVTDCVCTMLQALESYREYAVLGQQLFRGVVSLEEYYHLSVAHENTERSLNYCRIFTELAETFLEDIVRSRENNENHYAIKIFDLVLMCVGHHDYEVAQITFNLWCRLSEDLYQKNNETLTLTFKPYVVRLLASLCRHSRMEPDHEGLLEDAEEFHEFRTKVAELIKDVVFIVGSSDCFRQMFMELQGPGVTWDASEAALFVMQAVAKNLLPDANEVVPQVVEAILNLPSTTHVAVRHTSVLLLGELCEWIYLHPQSLEPALHFLLCGLQQPLLATASATALTSICETCSSIMLPQLNGLVQVVQALDSLAVKPSAASGLLRGVAAVVSRVPVNEMLTPLRKIVEVQLTPLVQLTKNHEPLEKGKRSDPTLYLDRLAVIVKYLEMTVPPGEVHPCAVLLKDMWPVLSAVLEQYEAESRVVERWCRCIRFIVRGLGRQSAHYLQVFVNQIVSQYRKHKHSSYLYLGSILLDECACEPQCLDELLEMLGSFIQPTFDLLQETNGLKNHPDTVEDLFRLSSRFLQRLPFAFLQCPATPSILECALMCCSLDHRDANAAVMKFFHDLITCSSRSNESHGMKEQQKGLVDHIIQGIGQRLINNLIQASVFSLHSYMLSGVADVLWDALEHDRVKVAEWLQEALSVLPTHNSGGVMTATEKQLEEFFKSVNRARSLKEVCHLLRDFARLYR